jgi:hypothetical protein
LLLPLLLLLLLLLLPLLLLLVLLASCHVSNGADVINSICQLPTYICIDSA